MSDSIQVAIKVRPLIKRERDENLPIQWSVQGNTIALIDSELKKRGDGRFCFDHIFDTNASNTDVFNSIVRPIVDAAVNGFNGTVFAYGQTSSGKTYTMMGTLDEPGVVPQAIEHMFNAITNTAGREFLLRVSYLEIYKEKVNDLLNKTGVHLKLKEDSNGQVFLQCKEEITNCPENMLSIMKKGDKNRRTGETNMNERSSRSHTIFRITIESRAAGDSDSAIQVSQLNLVDLAGSERARQTGATGERFKEGLHINLSLTTLGLVIKQLSEFQDGQKHVNFRDSKLTRLLQNSLGGNALTTIICAVTPAAVEETQCTLSFACRAKSVKNKPQINEVMSDAALLKRYAKQISKLQTELDKIKQENRVAEVEEMESKLQEKERVNQMLEERIELLKTRIVSGDTADEDTFKFKAKRRQTWGGPGLVSHLPAFQLTPSLSTTKQASHEKSCRKSIIQSVDMMNQTFQTAFTDFELELFKSECDRNSEENGSDSEDEKFITKRKHRVTFRDEVFTIESENSISSERMSGTPVRLNRNTATQTFSCQESPSTPKHVLRQCIGHLTKEFIELRQFTTLEKQLLSQDDGVKKLEETAPRRPAPEYTLEVKKRLKSLNLPEETNAEHVIAELCSKLDEFEKHNILEREASRKAIKQFSELERQVKNITSERDEFEYMSSELRAQLKKKTVELDLKNMSEESVKEVELKKISELERKLQKAELENTELRATSTKRITELQKEVENIVSERKEFDLIRRELSNQLNIKSLELDKLKNDPETANVEMTTHLQQLEKRAEQIAAEKTVMEQTIVDLRAELSRVSSDAEARIISERTAHEETSGKVSRLEKQVEDLAAKGNELERINVDLNARLDQNILDFESKIAAEQIARQEAANTNTELQEQLKSLIVEKQQLEASNVELSKTASEFESAMKSEHVARQEVIEKLSVLQKEVENIVSERKEFDRIRGELCNQLNIKSLELDQLKTNSETANVEMTAHLQQLEKIASEKAVMEQTIVDLRAELNRVSSDAEARIISERTAHEETSEQVSRLQKQVEDLAAKANELERVNVDLNARLNQNILDFESKITAEQIARQEAANTNTEFQEQLKSLIVEKQQLEASNVELSKTVSEFESAMKSEHVARQEMIEKLSVLQKEVENIVSERNEFDRIRGELCDQLNMKSLELDKLKNNPETANVEMTAHLQQLEKQAEQIATEKTVMEQTIVDLRAELSRVTSDAEARIISERTAHEETSGKVSRLEKQVEDLVAKGNELERVNVDLNARLDQNILDFESKIAAEKIARQEAANTDTEFQEQLKSLIVDKQQLEASNVELSKTVSEFESTMKSEHVEQQEMIDKLSILQKEVDNIVSERKEFDRIRGELCDQLNIKSLELDKLKNNPETANVEMTTHLQQLEKRAEQIASEKTVMEQTIVDLRAELSRVSSDAEARIISERTAHEETSGKVSRLEKQVEDLAAKGNELESVNVDLNARLDQNILDFESKIAAEKIARQEAANTNTELQEQLKSLIVEKQQLEASNVELSKTMSEFESAMKSDHVAAQEMIEKLTVLQKEVESVTLEKNVLKETLQLNTTELESRAALYQNVVEKASELEKRVADIVATKTELEKAVSSLRTEREEMLNRISELEKRVEGVTTRKDELEHENRQLVEKLKNDDNLVSEDNQSVLSYSRQYNDSTFDTSALMLSTEKSQLEESLYLKSQEVNEIKCDVQSLRQDIENLQETIYLLTTENKEMTEKLTTERENAKQSEANLQKTIDELYGRISDVTNQKIALESNLATLNDQLESMRSRDASTEVVSNDEELFAAYKNKIDMLTAENIELSTSIAEKNKELESIKESKSLLFDHECMYKEKAVALTEKNECLQAENDELSTDLIDKIEENDELKEQCEIFKKKMEKSLPKNEASTEGNADNLQLQNSMLKAEIVELNTKVTTLSKENAKFSNDLLQTIEDLEKSDVGAETSCKESLQVETHEAPTLTDKVATLQEKVDQLTRLNKKLSDLKLTSCNQCAHLKNLNESRRTLKLETKALNQKLEDLQRKFDRKCEDTEILKNKINQELSTSGRELSPNVSFVDEMNMSFVEERVRTLNDELQTLKADHDKLTVLYEDKCSELEQIRSNTSMDQLSSLDATPKKRSQKNSCRLVQIQSHIDQLKTDIDEMRKNSTNFAATLNQFRAEKAGLLGKIDGLRASNEELEQKLSTNEIITAEKIQVLENELTNMSKELEQLSDREKMLQSQRLTLEMELEELKIERDNKSAVIESLRNDLDLVTSQKNQLIANSMDNRYREELEASKRQREELNQQALARIGELQEQLVQREHLCGELQEKGVYVEQLYQRSEQEKHVLMERLQMVENNLQSNFEARYKGELESISAQYQLRVEETESNLRMLNDTLNKYVDENLNLKQELIKLKNVEEKQSESESASSKQRIDDIERLNGELSDIRLCIMKELKSLKCTINSAELSKQPVNEIFLILLQTLVSKEQEMMKAIRERYEKDKQLLEEEIQQSADTEKRATTWARELETEIEKLQAELTERERSQKEYENTISQKEHLLKESCRENEVLRESTRMLEADLQNLQTKFEKLCKVDDKQEEAIYVAQKREKEVQEMFKSKDLEFQSKLKAETEMHEKRINELARTVESYKTKNLEMNSAVEGLEANEKLLKNIIEANTIEIKKSSQSLERLSAELQQLTQAYNEANQQLAQKASHIEEISAILRNKCDTLSEYKAQLDAILPEHEVLKNHVGDQKTTIERYMQEVKALKTESEEQLQAIKDKLKAEEIKNVRLSKELNNRNVALTEELNELKEKYDELKQENAKLERKVRNSTSKIKAEAEVEELKEANKSLQSSLEGASNRVVELQEVKNQTLSQLIDTKAMYDLLLQENTKIKTTLSSYETKYNASSSSTHETKFDELLLEKNTIALELEYKKLQLTQKEKEVNEYASQVQQLQEKNKDLDEELDEYAKIIQERDLEISELEGKLHSRLTENTRISELEQKLENLNGENEKLRDQVDALNMRLQMDAERVADDIKSRQNENLIRILRRENLDLQTKLNSSKKQMDASQNFSDANVSWRDDDKLKQLKKKLHDLELTLVSKNGRLATLELQIQSQSFPYQKKCKELEEQLLAFRNKNTELSMEIKKLQRTVNDVNAWECDVCRRWRVNRKDQDCQTTPRIGFCSISSGVVEDQLKIQKLEKEKILMKAVCRGRTRRIKELEAEVDRLNKLVKT